MERAGRRGREKTVSSMFRIRQDQDPKLLYQFQELLGKERPKLLHRDVLSCFLSTYVYGIYCLLLWNIWHLKMCSTERFHVSMNRLYKLVFGRHYFPQLFQNSSSLDAVWLFKQNGRRLDA